MQNSNEEHQNIREYDLQYYKIQFKHKIPPEYLLQIPDVEDVFVNAGLFENWSHDDQIQPISYSDPRIVNLTMLQQVSKCFPISSVWNYSAFCKMYKSFAKHHKFAVKIEKFTKFGCKRSGIRKKQEPGTRTIQMNCQFVMKVKFLWNFQKLEGQQNRRLIRDESDKAISKVMVVALPAEDHNHECTVQDKMIVENASGTFSTSLTPNVIFMLLGFREKLTIIPSSFIRMFLELSSPKIKTWDKISVDNIRKKINRLHQKLTPDQYDDVDKFAEIFKSKDLSDIFDNDEEIFYTDESSVDPRKKLQEHFITQMNSSPNDDDSVNVLLERNKSLKECDDFFDFRARIDKNNRVVQLIWMTGQMRHNFDKFGTMLCYDVQKKQKNTHLLLYSGGVMHRPDQSLCLAFESLITSEDFDMYRFQTDSLFEMSHKRKSEDVYVVAADAILNQDALLEIGFTKKTRYMHDQFHLIEVNVANQFRGSTHFTTLRSYIYKCVNAASEEMFNQAFSQLAKRMMEIKCTAQQLQYMEELKSKKEHFVHYMLRKMPGSFGKKGNQGSESNHSSLESHLGKQYIAHPVYMQADLFMRNKQWDYKMWMKYSAEKGILISENDMIPVHALKEASSCKHAYSLDKTGYNIFKEEVKIALTLLKNGIITVTTNSIGGVSVRDKTYPNLVCSSDDARCSLCSVSVADLCQCRHDYLARNKNFVSDLFDRRYIYEENPSNCRIERNGKFFTKDTSQDTYRDSKAPDEIDELVEMTKSMSTDDG